MWVVEFSLYFWGQVSFKERADEKRKTIQRNFGKCGTIERKPESFHNYASISDICRWQQQYIL